ncbi:MAG: pyridoxine 5'-phosphate synthase [Pseudomonadota bacterium]
MSTALSVNVNAIALLRNRRDLPWPSVVDLSRIALAAGAHGITVHPRPDERHIRRSDVPDLRALIDDEFPHTELNVEGYPTDDFLTLVREVQPEQVTLVPDDPSQPTSDHGWNFRRDWEMLAPIVQGLKSDGFRVALFADAEADQVPYAVKTGTDRLELYTGPYGATHANPGAAGFEIERLSSTAVAAREAGMGINAGHDLTVDNLILLRKFVPDIDEVSIGHGLTADALEYGMAQSVRRFLTACGHAGDA